MQLDHQAIQERAYQLWESEGKRSDVHPDHYWLLAEKQLKNEFLHTWFFPEKLSQPVQDIRNFLLQLENYHTHTMLPINDQPEPEIIVDWMGDMLEWSPALPITISQRIPCNIQWQNEGF